MRWSLSTRSFDIDEEYNETAIWEDRNNTHCIDIYIWPLIARRVGSKGREVKPPARAEMELNDHIKLHIHLQILNIHSKNRIKKWILSTYVNYCFYLHRLPDIHAIVFSSCPFERCLLEGRKGVIVSFIVNNQII